MWMLLVSYFNFSRKAFNQLPQPSQDAIAPLIHKLLSPQLDAYTARLSLLEQQLSDTL